MLKWSVIIIGRNEGRHLRNCIHSVKRALEKVGGGEIIYVDSSSRDDSIKIALSEGIQVIGTDFPRPTAGVSRNVGAKYAVGEYIQFIDADIYMDEDWLLNVERAFKEYDDVSMVCGQLEEANDGKLAKFYSVAWTERKVGYLEYPIGGGGAFKKKDFLDIGGYNINLLRGEETELGYRMRSMGYKILGIPSIYGTHHLNVRNIFDFFKRIKNMAISYTYNYLDKDYSYNKIFYNQAKRNLVQGIILIFVLFFLISVLFINFKLFFSIIILIFLFILPILINIKINNYIFILEKIFLNIFEIFFLFKTYLKYQKSYPKNELKNDNIIIYNFLHKIYL